MLRNLKSLSPQKLYVRAKNFCWQRWSRARTFSPYIPDRVDIDLLMNEVANFLKIPYSKVASFFTDYRDFYESRQYTAILGERKTLSFEEAFVIYLLLAIFRPPNIIEIGTQFGKSTRKIIDMRDRLALASPITCFDIVNDVKYFSPHEALLILKDLTDSFRYDVLLTGSGFIFLDAHPYRLLETVIVNVLSSNDWILAIHDCSKGLCNPKMQIRKDDTHVTSQTGLWERYVLAEAFGVGNALSAKLDAISTQTHSMRIFSTAHGLAVIMPNTMLQREQDD